VARVHHWLKRYLYVPLGGNRGGPHRRSVNVLCVFLWVALWHDASLKLAAWGLAIALLFALERRARAWARRFESHGFCGKGAWPGLRLRLRFAARAGVVWAMIVANGVGYLNVFDSRGMVRGGRGLGQGEAGAYAANVAAHAAHWAHETRSLFPAFYGAAVFQAWFYAGSDAGGRKEKGE
jgi:hypothetical protein